MGSIGAETGLPPELSGGEEAQPAETFSESVLQRAQRGEILVIRGDREIREVSVQARSFLAALIDRLFHFARKVDLSKAHEVLSKEQLAALFRHVHDHSRESMFVPMAICRSLVAAGLSSKTLISSNVHFRLSVPNAGLGTVHRTPPHRDSWYRLPPEGVNVWIPTTIVPGTGVAFYPRFFGRPLRRSRYNPDTFHPDVLDVDFEREAPFGPACDEGECLIFSGDHLHATLPNLSASTRISWDYRILPLEGLRASTRLHEFVLPETLLERPDDEAFQHAETQRRLRRSGYARISRVRGLTSRTHGLIDFTFRLARVLGSPWRYTRRLLGRRTKR